MDIHAFVQKFIQTSNAYDLDGYLALFHEHATLEDVAVGETFIGHEGIKDYFNTYFIEYETQTDLTKLDIHGDSVHIEADFSGNFSKDKLKGYFEFVFQHDKIAQAKANLI